MKLEITKGMDNEGKEEVGRAAKLATPLTEALVSCLKKKIEDRGIYATQDDRYQMHSWAYLQADTVGYVRALNEVINLLKSTLEKK